MQGPLRLFEQARIDRAAAAGVDIGAKFDALAMRTQIAF
jgi:hypothetical protein